MEMSLHCSDPEASGDWKRCFSIQSSCSGVSNSHLQRNITFHLFPAQPMESRLPVVTKEKHPLVRMNPFLSAVFCLHVFSKSRLPNVSGISRCQNKGLSQLSLQLCVHHSQYINPKCLTLTPKGLYQLPDSQCLQPGRTKGSQCLVHLQYAQWIFFKGQNK